MNDDAALLDIIDKLEAAVEDGKGCRLTKAEADELLWQIQEFGIAMMVKAHMIDLLEAENGKLKNKLN